MVVPLSRRDLIRGRHAAKATQRRIARIATTCLETGGVVCRRCDESCMMRAIRFPLAQGGHPVAEVDRVRCNGCGDCVAPCPVHAITLVALGPDAEPGASLWQPSSLSATGVRS